MVFKNVMMLTSVKQGVSEKTQKTYIIVTALDKEEGKTIDLMYRGETFDWTKLKPYNDYTFTLKVNFGKFVNVNVLDIKEVVK